MPGRERMRISPPLCCAWFWLCVGPALTLLLSLPPVVVPTSWFASSGCVGSAGAAAAADNGASTEVHRLASPLLDREIQATVKANWPSSPHSVFCEAYAYLSSEGLGRAFLDRLAGVAAILRDDGTSSFSPLSSSGARDDSRWTYESALKAVLEASSYTSRSQKSLLRWFIAMRAASPACELFRGLAVEASPKLANSGSNRSDLVSFAIAYPSGRVVEDWSLLAVSSIDADGPSWSADSLLIDGEVVFQGTGTTSDSPRTTWNHSLVVLYADLGTRTFVEMYRKLTESKARFVVRPFGGVDERSSPSTVLQGYGVTLDIRNVEYKVFDDRSEKGNTEDAQLLNLSNASLRAPPVFLSGINVTHFGSTMNDTDRQQLQASLWHRHDAQQILSQIVPPVWQRRQLPLQATAVIVNSTDPLATLQEISQNLPSLASTLVHVKVPDDLVNRTKGLEPFVGRMYLNGCPIYLGQPSFNVFELMNLLRDEQRSLMDLQSNLGPFLDTSQLRMVQQAWSKGRDFMQDTQRLAPEVEDEVPEEFESGMDGQETIYRVDVGHGWKQAVIYLNDVEKDVQYSRWPVQLEQMLMMMQFGRPPSVRRNLFTFLSVVDPVAQPRDNGLRLAMQVMSAMYPARTGLLIVNEDDVRECAKWVVDNGVGEGEACPVGRVLMGKPRSMDDLGSIKASTYAVHSLLSQFARTHGNQGDGSLQAYAEYLFEYLSNEKAKKNGDLSMGDLVSVHGSLMEGLNILSEEEGESEAFDTLVEGSQRDEDFSYGKALRFAVDKALTPGLSFINGRPLPSDGQSAAETFRHEQGLVFNLIVAGEITDRSPKSVYGTLLSGDFVFRSFHPLLRGDEDVENKYIEPRHNFGLESLFVPTATSKDGEASAVFVLESVVDYSTVEGVNLLEATLDVIQSLRPPLLVKDNIALAYRFLPGSFAAAASSLCPVLARASLLNLDSLKKIVRAYAGDMSLPVASLLKTEPSLSQSATQAMSMSTASDPCRSRNFSDPKISANYMLLNGRMFKVDAATAVDRNAFDILITLELQRAKAVTRLLGKVGESNFDGISRTAAFLAREETLAASGLKRRRSYPFASKLSPTRLRLSWNDDEINRSEELQTSVVAIVDPATFAAQRMSPILRIVRDELKLPLTVLFSPAELIDGDSVVPITSYYRFVAHPQLLPEGLNPEAHFHNLPVNHVLTLKVDVPEPWNVQQSYAVQDTDNLRCDTMAGCGDQHSDAPMHEQRHLTQVEYDLKSLLVFGRCVETSGRPPNGLQLVLSRDAFPTVPAPVHASDSGIELGMDGSIFESRRVEQGQKPSAAAYSDTLVMLNIGYWQLQAAPGVWSLQIANESRGATIFSIVEGTYRGSTLVLNPNDLVDTKAKRIVVKDFVNQMEVLAVKRRSGFETASLFSEYIPESNDTSTSTTEDEVINVFSLATGHLYERFLKIMMLSVTKRTSSKVKFWLFENFLSPSFKASARFMAEKIGSQVEFVTYKWPEWLRGQSEKQRIIWGYKILFLDVLFPLSVKKFIYVDADQVLRGDLKELWDLDLHGAPYAYTPFCTSRETTLGYQFWREGFWKQHLGDLPYHISALYVVDLERFRRGHVGDTLRSVYQQLSADPNSLANLDQDLPNYAQRQVPIYSLPQEWLWCESWCSDETKAQAKTIDLCNNPLHKEPKVSMAKRVISGPLFNESWVELDAEVERYDQLYRDGSSLLGQ